MGLINTIKRVATSGLGVAGDVAKDGLDYLYGKGQDVWDEYSGRNEADRQREFNAEQAQTARDFAERMSNTAHQRETADLRAAGLNPMFAVSKGMHGSSTPSPSGATSGNIDVGRNIQGAMQTLLLKGQIGLLEAQANRENSAAGLNNSQSKLAETQAGDITATQESRLKQYAEGLNEIMARIDNTKADTKNKEEVLNEIKERVSNLQEIGNKLEHETGSAKSKAAIDAELAAFAQSLGGDIQRWSDALGIKGSDLLDLVPWLAATKLLKNGSLPNPDIFHKGRNKIPR